MSWGKTASGTGQQVLGTCANWAAEVAKTDEQWASEPVKVAHQGQATAAAASVAQLVASYPEDTVSVRASARCSRCSGTRSDAC